MASTFITSNIKKYLLLVLFLTSGLATCTKDIHSLGKAKYNFKSDQEKCSIRVNGTYNRNISLADSNSIDIDAHVITKGPYFISTDTANGIYFTAFGVLTDTGDYTFHLAGQGKPKKGGVTHLTLLSYHTICSVDVPVDTINMSEYAWEFYDNNIHRHGHATNANLTHEYVWNDVTISGPENENSPSNFRLNIKYNDPLELSTLPDSITHSFIYAAYKDGQWRYIRGSDTTGSILKIDSYDERTRVLKGRFSWTGKDSEGIIHEIKEGKFYVQLVESFY